MGLVMVLGIAAVIAVCIVVVVAVSCASGDKLNRASVPYADEKPKRDRLMLSKDGELLEIVDNEWARSEKPKRVHEGKETSSSG